MLEEFHVVLAILTKCLLLELLIEDKFYEAYDWYLSLYETILTLKIVVKCPTFLTQDIFLTLFNNTSYCFQMLRTFFYMKLYLRHFLDDVASTSTPGQLHVSLSM